MWFTFVGGLRLWHLKLFYIFEWFYICGKVSATFVDGFTLKIGLHLWAFYVGGRVYVWRRYIPDDSDIAQVLNAASVASSLWSILFVLDQFKISSQEMDPKRITDWFSSNPAWDAYMYMYMYIS